LLSTHISRKDPLWAALRNKAQTGAPGIAQGRQVAAGTGWRVVDIICTAGPRDRPFQEQHQWASISIVLSGTFHYRSRHGAQFMSPGAILLGSPRNVFECSHDHGEGDRCLSFQYDPKIFDEVARDAGASRFAFTGPALPPLRSLAPITTRAVMAMEAGSLLEEIALELAGLVLQSAGPARRGPSDAIQNSAAIARVVRQLECRRGEAIGLDQMAQIARLSRYHFLRTFKSVTGITPHQWLLRARLRDAAQRLAATRASVTDIALDSGFDDLSNFIRTFRAEFGLSPSKFRISVPPSTFSRGSGRG
jgi:AraC family transcriptional regulator